MTDETSQRLERLEARVQQLEDELAIYRLLASYGPAADSASEPAMQALWTVDGVYDVDGLAAFRGREAIGGMLQTTTHRTYVETGSAHVISLPRVALHGNTAVATSYSQVCKKDGDHWRVDRAAANRWELVREAGGWRVKTRINRLLNGSTPARELLGSAFDP